MKKTLLTFLIGVFTCLHLFAAPVDSTNAVTMVSYEQNWIDMDGTLALKNNTSEVIHNVTFHITYLDMSGKELDYEEFYKEVNIEPGKTRKIDIRAYEHERNYHYYKSENSPTGSPAFKIKFELKEYNSANKPKGTEYEDTFDPYDSSSDSDGLGFTTTMLITLIVGIIIISAIIGSYVLVAVMAKKRNRNVALWVFLSIVASPILIAIILLVIGEDDRTLV